MGQATEAKESTESGEVDIPLHTIQILCVLCGSTSDLAVGTALGGGSPCLTRVPDRPRIAAAS